MTTIQQEMGIKKTYAPVSIILEHMFYCQVASTKQIAGFQRTVIRPSAIAQGSLNYRQPTTARPGPGEMPSTGEIYRERPYFCE